MDGRMQQVEDAVRGSHTSMEGLQQQILFTQVALTETVEQAKTALNGLTEGFRAEVVALREKLKEDGVQHLAQVQALAGAAQDKFLYLESSIQRLVGTLETRLAALDAHAQGEGPRVNAMLAAAGTAQGGSLTTPPGVPQQAAAPQPAPATGAASDPWASAAGDPWSSASGGPPGGPLGGPPSGPPGGPPGGPQMHRIDTPVHDPTRRVHEYRVDNRAWGDNRRLDLITQPEGYLIWRDRALGHLSRDRPDVKRLLVWGEKQSAETLAVELGTAAHSFGLLDLASVDYALFEGIKHIVADTLLGRARSCEERGIELWRRLHVEWEGTAPQLRHAKARKYQDPDRCKNVLVLWEALPAWEHLGEEIKAAGFEAPDWVKTSALEKLVPLDLLSVLVGRPELDTYARKLHWVRCQMEHARGASQARAVSGLKEKEDVHMVGAVSTDASDGSQPTSDALVWSLQECARTGDWDGMTAISGALQALTKGKGKGKLGKGGGKGNSGGGKAGKGWSKGASSPSTPAPPGDAEYFDGVCNHCGNHGHRKIHCRKLDREMAAKRAAGGGKSGGKGGKGIYACDGDEEEQQQQQPSSSSAGNGRDEDGAGEEWWMGAINCVSKELPSAAVRPLASARLCGTLASARLRGAAIHNRYACLTVHEETATVARIQCSVVRDDGDEGGLVCAVSGTRTAGQMIEAVVDSGAEESVAPPGLFPGLVTSSPMSRAGRKYRAANGTRIQNLGQTSVSFKTPEGHHCGMPFQIAEVERPLIAVSQLAAAGNRIELGKDGGKIVNLVTGKVIHLLRKGGVYVLQMKIEAAAAPGFPGQGK
jgi:hypothetical protein